MTRELFLPAGHETRTNKRLKAVNDDNEIASRYKIQAMT